MIRLFTYSLSLRLIAIFLLLAALFAWGVVAGIRWAYNADDLRALVSGHLSLHVGYVREDIGSPPRLDRALAITQRVPVDIHIEGPGVNWSSDPDFPALSTLDFGASDYFSAEPGALFDELEGVDFALHDDHRYLRFNEGGYDIVVVTPKIATRQARPPLIPILVGFALLLVLCGYLAVRWLFRPVATIRTGAAYIGAGHFGHRIRTRRDEFGELAEDINLMASKVEGMLDAKRQLLLGVSHELRSPISRLTLGLALLEESAPVRALQQDVREMREIVETLLDAERLESPHSALQLEEVDPDELVRDLVSRYFGGETRLHLQLKGTPPALLDPARIQLMLKNLVGNALRYSAPEDGPVEVGVEAVNGGGLLFRVRDHGPGIPLEQRAGIGEPFYRPDASRARDTGGTGLGLYLAHQIARAHGGELRMENVIGRGASFIVQLSPLARDAASTQRSR